MFTGKTDGVSLPKLEVWTRPGLARPTGQWMRDGFSNGPGTGRQMRDVFPKDQAGKREMNFTAGRAELSKEKWIFQRWKKKGRRITLGSVWPEKTKTKSSNRHKKKNNNVLDLGDSKYKCENEMCFLNFHYRIINKDLLILPVFNQFALFMTWTYSHLLW